MDGDALMQYILKLKGVAEEEEKYTLPSDFLMEMLELNEAVSEYEMDPDNNKKEVAVSSWQKHIGQLTEGLETVTTQYDRSNNEGLLKQVKDLYYRKKYLLRIQQRINTFAAH